MEVFRLLTLLFSTLCLASFVWFGLTVDLGERTLFGHLRAIGGSEPAQQLWSGVKSKVNDFVGIESARKSLGEGRASEDPSAAGPPQETLDDADRSKLRRLLEERGASQAGSGSEARKRGLAQAPERK